MCQLEGLARCKCAAEIGTRVVLQCHEKSQGTQYKRLWGALAGEVLLSMVNWLSISSTWLTRGRHVAIWRALVAGMAQLMIGSLEFSSNGPHLESILHGMEYCFTSEASNQSLSGSPLRTA